MSAELLVLTSCVLIEMNGRRVQFQPFSLPSLFSAAHVKDEIEGRSKMGLCSNMGAFDREGLSFDRRVRDRWPLARMSRTAAIPSHLPIHGSQPTSVLSSARLKFCRFFTCISAAPGWTDLDEAGAGRMMLALWDDRVALSTAQRRKSSIRVGELILQLCMPVVFASPAWYRLDGWMGLSRVVCEGRASFQRQGTRY